MEKMKHLTIYYHTTEFEFDAKRSRSLWDKMTLADQELFFCDVRKIDWDEMFYRFWPGMRVYLANDPMDNLQKSKKNYIRIRYTHYFLMTLLCLILTYIINKIISVML